MGLTACRHCAALTQRKASKLRRCVRGHWATGECAIDNSKGALVGDESTRLCGEKAPEQDGS